MADTVTDKAPAQSPGASDTPTKAKASPPDPIAVMSPAGLVGHPEDLAAPAPTPKPEPEPVVVKRTSAATTPYYIADAGLWVAPGEQFESSLLLSDALFPLVKE